ncbi:RHS repeat-associated core domain-containing protein [Nonomuraea sp. NPDC005983]|uniref:LamG-like jellyroll fold domain-containing protein n=1 Tax=Nonomuraea sp. NPDC005983 TaxID=3155595 RepID=UPI0033AFBD59
MVKHKHRIAVGALTVLVPGLLQLSVLPQTAAMAVSVTAASSAVDTPEQMVGSTTNLPSLVDSAVTGAKAGIPGQSPSWPKKALSPDGRTFDGKGRSWSPPEGRSHSERKDKADVYDAATTRAQLVSGGGCTLECVSTFNAYPQDQALISTLTPLMTAKSRISGWLNGGVALDYSFTLYCGDFTTTPCAESGWSRKGSWQTPAGKLEWGKKYCVKFGARYYDNTENWEFNCFTTGIRQPVVTSTLGAPGPDGQEFEALSGNYTTTETDAQVATVGPGLSVTRWYNSLDPRRSGIFGAGWSTRWDMRIQREMSLGVDSLLVTYPQGQVLRFIAKGGGGYQPPPGMHATLAENAGGGWRLMDKASTTYTFDAQGRLVKIVDARGRAQDLTYTGTSLTKVTATGGRSLTFTWSGAHVGSVSTDPVDGSPLTWTYHYEGEKLVKACSPAAAPNCTTYGYTTGSQYKNRVLDTDPTGYWRLGESGSGSGWSQPVECRWNPDAAVCQPPATEAARDLTGTSGTAIYDNVTTRGRPSPLSGSADTAIGLDGEIEMSNYVILPRNALASRHMRMSVEMWFKTTGSGVLISARDTRESYGYSGGAPSEEPIPSLLYVGTDGKLRGQLYRGATPANVMTTSATVNDGQWHHVVLTGDGPTETIYLDGQRAATRTGSQPNPETWLEYARIGQGHFTQDWPAAPSPGQAVYSTFLFKGEIDEVAVYDKALDIDQVNDHYAARGPALHLLNKITLPSGRVWAQNTYDGATDRLKTHTDQHGGTWTLTEPVYDGTTGLSTVTMTDPQTNTLKYSYDAWRGYRLAAKIDQLEKKTSFAYDTGGFISQVTDPNNNSVTLANDSRGNTLATTTCREAGKCQTVRSEYYVNKDDPFDARNDRLVKSRDARSSSATDTTYLTTIEYNQYGEQIKQTTPATPDFPSGRSTEVAYTDGTEPAVGGGSTPAGLTKSKTDARGSVWNYRYTATGDLAEQTDPTGLVTKLEYDPLGRVINTTQVSSAHPDGVTTTFTYDALSRPLMLTEPGVKNEISGVTHTKRTTFAYDSDGNKLSDTIADLTGGDAARATVYTYDVHGQVETVTDPEGGFVRQDWNPLGLLARTTDARGSIVEYGYSKRGELASRTLKAWTGSPVNPQPAKDVVLESFSYDPGGRLAAQVDAMGRKTSYTYFNDNRLAQKIGDDVKLNGSTTPGDVTLEDHTYDDAGNETKLVTGGDTKTTTEFEYDAAGRLTSQLFDPTSLKRKTAFVYDANGNTLKTTLTGGDGTRAEIKEYAYNKANQPTKETVENGAEDLVSTTDYDDRGLVTARTDPRGNVTGANKADFTTALRYDLLGRLVEATGPEVKVDKAGAVNTGRPTARYGYDTLGAKTHATDAEGRTLTSTFDKAGRLTGQSAPSYTPPGGTAVIPTTRNAYDKAGQLISTTDPRGYVRTFDYDQLGRQVRVTDPAPDGQTPGRWITEYDLVGEKLAAVDPNGARVQATFDDLGRQVTQTEVERKPASASYTTTMTYNEAGYLTKTVAPGPGNKTTDYKVNAAGEVTSQTDPATNKTSMDYDLAGRLVKTTDARGNATTAEYDLAGRKIGTKDLDSTGATVRSTSVGYDPASNPTSSTSPEGHVTKQTFDALGRVTSLVEPVSDSESITTSFGYDATGARTRLTDGRGNATWTSYNSLGLVETVTEPSTTAHPNAADRTWTAVYDQAGNAVAELQPGGVRIDRTFDHLGRLTKESGAGGGAASAERTFGYDLAGHQTAIGDLTVDYNDRSLPLAITRSSAQQTAYTYDELGNPTQRVDAAGTSTFTWDNAGRLATAADPVTGRKLTYGYDKANNLASLTAAKGTTTTDTQIFTYDAVDRLETQTLRKGGSSGTQLAKITYGWDKDDSLTSKTTAGTAGAGTNTYTYDHAGRLTSWTAPGGATTTYGWDAAGNRTKAGDKTYTFDERNRLTSGDGTDYTYTPRGTLATETKNGTTTQLTFDAFDRLIADGDSLYSYDALDRVTSRIKGATKQTFAYAGLANDLAAISDTSAGIQAKYGRDAFGALLGQQEGTNPALATMTDLHGDLVATYDTTNLATTTAYDPFGTITAQTGAKANLGYQGEYTDPDTGKVNMHARWYQPGTGTFTTRDTATLNPNPSVQANRYTYANASPLSNVDPTGHDTVPNSWNNGGSGWGDTSGGYSGDICSGYVAICGGGGDGGRVIGGGFGGGGGGMVGCSGPGLDICGAADFSAVAETDPQWYFENFILPHLPAFDDEEAKRIGVMSNGMRAPKGFWGMSAEERMEFTMFASWINFINPSISEEELLGVGAPSGGGFAGAPERSYYHIYKKLLPYQGIIRKAAKEHGVDRNALLAVLIYENMHLEPTTGLGANLLAEGSHFSNKLSLGMSQLEIYRAQALLKKYYKNDKALQGYAKSDRLTADLLVNNHAMAIRLAAARLRDVKATIRITDKQTGKTRPINDWEATLAYCGCSGSGDKQRRFLEGGAAPNENTEKRRKFMLGGEAFKIVDEYWRCVADDCDW